MGRPVLILLDTSVWVRWVQGDQVLGIRALTALSEARFEVNAVSVFSCWEIGMLHKKGRLSFSCSLDEWFEKALAYPALRVVNLTRDIAVDSTRLPGDFHGDPADRIIVQTARQFNCSVMTTDRKILAYPHVSSISPTAVGS